MGEATLIRANSLMTGRKGRLCLGDIPIYLAMRRGDADGAGAEGRINGPIGDYFQVDFFTGEFGVVFLADEFFIAGIVWLNGHSRVADFGFRTGSGNGNGKIFGIFKV